MQYRIENYHGTPSRRVLRNRHITPNIRVFFVLGVFIVIGALLVLFKSSPNTANSPQESPSQPQQAANEQDAKPLHDNPLQGKTFYRDDERIVTKRAKSLRDSGDTTNAELLERISSQSAATWLVGPNEGDPTAQRDIDQVKRTSEGAATQGTVAIYQLYAIPKRDACAGYSKGGFSDSAAYLGWLDRILSELRSEAVFLIEADAIGHAAKGSCMSVQEIEDRYALLSATVAKLKTSPRVIATYLDATHSEWFPNANELVEPLKKSGIGQATGIAVNVSNFVSTETITPWAQSIVTLLGEDKGIIIDTSRNGQGSVDASVSGDARWCNPAGRGIGFTPRSDVSDAHVHAYLWVKGIGESDGDCFGYAPAGQFILEKALELARNAQN